MKTKKEKLCEMYDSCQEDLYRLEAVLYFNENREDKDNAEVKKQIESAKWSIKSSELFMKSLEKQMLLCE